MEFDIGDSILAKLASIKVPNLKTSFFLFPKQTQDDITSIRLLKPQVLRNVSVIRWEGDS
jgi:hypothetical protein